MASTQLFSGDWTVTVFSKDAAFSERFVIEGSVSSDGAYAGETTTHAGFGIRVALVPPV
jgi:hypothetical protein